jgi:hypothetical protein
MVNAPDGYFTAELELEKVDVAVVRICERCSAWVWHTDVHDRWHNLSEPLGTISRSIGHVIYDDTVGQ